VYSAQNLALYILYHSTIWDEKRCNFLSVFIYS